MQQPEEDEVTRITGRWVLRAVSRLRRARRDIDSLNVYPVPDGDTGTNLWRTLASGLDAVRAADAAPAQWPAVFTRGVLLGARGNSGVIASQMVRGGADLVDRPRRGTARDIAAALTRADSLAWAAVAEPADGTILTVSAAAAAAAREAAALGPDPVAAVDAAVAAAEAALASTTALLPALARAGVVDAGGAGYVVVLRALADTLHGTSTGTVVAPGPVRPGGEDHAGPAFEVMYVLHGADAAGAGRLRDALAGLGDSVVVAPGDEGTSVHVHTDDVAAVTQAGLAEGRISGLRVVDLHHGPTEAHGRSGRRGAPGRPPAGVGLVACVDGPGLAALVTRAGGGVVLSSAGARASTGDLLDAARSRGVRDVIVLANDHDARLAADQAAREAEHEGIAVHVVPTSSQPQGIAALAVFDPTEEVGAAVRRLTDAARATRAGKVTFAERAAATEAGDVAPGQAVGLVGSRAVVVGEELLPVACSVADELLQGGGELVTLVVGHPAVPGLAEGVAEHVRLAGAEPTVIDGGQRHYPLLLGVE